MLCIKLIGTKIVAENAQGLVVAETDYVERDLARLVFFSVCATLAADKQLSNNSCIVS